MFRNVVVGISGGVDSAVTAFLLKEKGFRVLGVFMKNWDEFDERGRCSGEQDLLDAEFTCNKLQIELKQLNYVKDYWNSVFTHFLEDYQNGLTPNPDILCNKHIKFDLFYKYAIDRLKYDAIATGHYAKTSYGSYLEDYKDDGDVRLLVPRDTFKDQTFFLSGVKRDALARTMFPLDKYLKSEVKELARKCGLQRLASKKESTGICFVGNRDFKEFIREYIICRRGEFIDVDSRQVVGHHDGIHQWTIGQRCRLASYRQPYYVASKDVGSNAIYVAAGHNNPALFSDTIITATANWLSPVAELDVEGIRCHFRFQHTKPLVPCHVQRNDDQTDGLIVTLDEPLRAITPGQYAVFYRDGECLGSARIVRSRPASGSQLNRQLVNN